MTGNILEQAKQGNPNAIAALMSRSMKSQGIDVKASLDGRCLEVILEAAKVPTPATTVSFIRKGMTNLGVHSIDTVRVSAYQTGDSTPAWQEEIVLHEPTFSAPPPSMSSSSSSQFSADETDALLDEEDLLAEDLLQEELSSPGYDSASERNLYHDNYGNELPEDVTEFTPDDEYSATDYGRGEELSLDDEADGTVPESSSKKRSSALPLLLLLLTGLGLGGYYLYTQKPELLAGLPFFNKNSLPTATTPETTASAPEAAAPTAVSPAPKTESSAPAVAADNPFPAAVRKATSAAQLTQTASTPADWTQVAADWQSAIELMQSVPQSNPQYSVAQQRIPVYQQNLQYAQKLAGN